MSFVSKKISEKENVLIQQAQKDELKPSPGMTIRESFERSVELELHKAPDDSGRRAQIIWRRRQ